VPTERTVVLTSNPFTAQFSRSVPQVSIELRLPTTATTAVVLNTSSTAGVTVNTAGPALLDPPSGTALTPGQSTTVALQAPGGGTLVLSAIATGPDASVQITMTPVTIDVGGTVMLEPGVPTEQAQ
jgi:hypothetical protein